MTRRILAAAAAVVLALVAGGAVLLYVRTADARALAGQEAVKTWIAAETVPAGTTLRTAIDDGLIRPELVALKGVPAGALQDRDIDDDLRAVGEIVPGEIVLTERFDDEVAVEGRLVVPEGKLAVTVELTDPAKVGQFLTVGSSITVFDTFNVQEADPDGLTPAGDRLQERHEYTRATRVLLPEVEVLAIGQTTTKQTTSDPSLAAEQASAQQVTTTQTVTLVTVAVDQAQAEKLVHGIHTGTLYFALRSGDVEVVVGEGTNDRGLFGVDAP
jgi:pilus assembly protein CpaB